MERKISVRDEFAEKFVSLLESDKALEWTKGWQAGFSAPYNGATRQKYHGVNRLVLCFEAAQKGWTQPEFYTFNQIRQMGLKVAPGEHATRVEYWMGYDTKEKKSLPLEEMECILRTDPTRTSSEFTIYPKSYYIFNASQVQGLEPLEVKKHAFDNNKLADAVIDCYCTNTGVNIFHSGDKAYYSLSKDIIVLPPKESFNSAEDYYGTTFHEAVHSTGHSSRLARDMSTSDPDKYAIEELRAEIAATYVCAELDIKMPDDVVNNHLAYVQSWLKQIKQDHNVLFTAIRDAEKAADYFLEQGRADVLREKFEVYEQEPKGLSGKKIEVWQLSDADYNNAILFAGYKEASQYSLNSSRYVKQWEGIARPEDKTLEDIFMRFNVSREDFSGRSMSVSDVVVVDDEAGRHAYYCDVVGFKELPGFFQTLQRPSLVRAV